MTIVEKANAPMPARTESDNSVSSTLTVTLPHSTVARVRFEIFAQREQSRRIAVASRRLDLQPQLADAENRQIKT